MTSMRSLRRQNVLVTLWVTPDTEMLYINISQPQPNFHDKFQSGNPRCRPLFHTQIILQNFRTFISDIILTSWAIKENFKRRSCSTCSIKTSLRYPNHKLLTTIATHCIVLVTTVLYLLIADNKDALQRHPFRVNNTCKNYNMKISTQKTKSLIIARESIRFKLSIDDKIIGQVMKIE